MNIRRRIFIPMITLAIVSSIAVFVSSILLYNRSLTNAAYNRINVAVAAVEHEIESYKYNSRVAATLMTESHELRQAIKDKDNKQVLQKAHELQRVMRMDFCTITDDKGIVIARTHHPDLYGDDITYQLNISAALEGKTENTIEQGTAVKLAVRTGVPVKDDDGNIIGVISLGYRLDTQDLVYILKNITNCEISIFLNDERISTTILNEDGTFALGTKLDDNIMQSINQKDVFTGKSSVLDRSILLYYIPLYKHKYDVAGVIGVGEYTRDDEDKIKAFIKNGLFISLIVFVICIILGRYIAKSFDHQLGIMLDVMQETLQEKRELGYLLNILNGLDAMIYVTNPKTSEILFINESMKTHYKIFDDVVGQVCYKVLQKGLDARCEFCPCYKLDDDPLKTITWEEHSSKTNRIYRNVDRYIPWINGQIVHIQHSVDMTELISAKEVAEQSSRYKTAFLANMSHEVRTPMNAILGIAEIQLREEDISPSVEEAFAKIYDSGSLLLHIINDILDLSKIEAGKMELIPVKYDIPSLINDTSQINLLRYESKPITFKIDVDPNTPMILLGDELRIKQILNNILSNAFKYTHFGEIKLSVSAEEINDEEDMVMLILTVSDTGQGMTEDQINKLFDEYTRFNLQANRTTIGTGLGMTITRHFLDMMKGTISVNSKPGKGSVFTVKIPQQRMGDVVCGKELADKLRSFTFHSTSIGKKSQVIREYMPYGSVLIVDDVESNLYVAKGMLMSYGLKIDTATSGFEAVENIKSGKIYDIIFMDHMMPKMDGIEAVKIIRNLGYDKSIVALTANALVGQANLFLENGFDGYISKPIDSRELNHILNELIRNKQTPEVVQKARLEQQQKNERKNNKKAAPSEVEKFFILDAERAIDLLLKMFSPPRELEGYELESYIIAIHGIKSALANIGEKKLSGIALKLEEAGRNKDSSLILNETPDFIKELQSLVNKFKPQKKEEKKSQILDEDMQFIKEELKKFKEECLSLNKKKAKQILNDIKEKNCPQHINTVLDELSTLLLHSAFEEAAATVDKIL